MIDEHLPGQYFVPHCRVSLLTPVQFSPPKDGGGLEQVLLRDWLPPPHVTEQVSQGDQTDQLPFTDNMQEKVNKVYFQFEQRLDSIFDNCWFSYPPCWMT